MKKLLGVFVVLTVLVTTGCGNTKKLECTQTHEYGSQTIILEYTKDGILKHFTWKNQAKDYVEGELTTAERAELNEACNDYKEFGVENCSVNIRGNDVELVINVKNVDKLSADELYDMDLDYYADYTYEDLKKELTEEGLTCK